MTLELTEWLKAGLSGDGNALTVLSADLECK